ncbi:MAG: hypothetical protein P4M13_07685 [Alphaproteobacteria bacterium]|nr:hypothetical protein [Alphaproteobacteria bacterium]
MTTAKYVPIGEIPTAKHLTLGTSGEKVSGQLTSFGSLGECAQKTDEKLSKKPGSGTGICVDTETGAAVGIEKDPKTTKYLFVPNSP